MAKRRLCGSFYGVVRSVNGRRVTVWVKAQERLVVARSDQRRIPRPTKEGFVSFDRPKNGAVVPTLRSGMEVYGPIVRLDNRVAGCVFGFKWLSHVDDLVRALAIVGPFSGPVLAVR